MRAFVFGVNGLKIGRILKDARIKKGITLSEASKALLIQENYLEAIESDIDDILPAGVYKLIYTRAYCRYLGVEYKEEVEQKPEENVENDEEYEKNEPEKSDSDESESLELDLPLDINRSFRIGMKIIVTIVVIYMIVKLFQLVF